MRPVLEEASSPAIDRGGWWLRSLPYAIALTVLLVYAGIALIRLQRDGSALPFVVMGTSNTPGNHGYDGQFYYRMATVSFGTTRGFDQPAYRWQRIGYPILARALALDRRDAVPAALVLINVAAIAGGTLAIGLLLRRNGFSPVYALAWAGYAGQAAAFWRDLAEPLAMLLVAAALLCLRSDRLLPAGLLLGAAALGKETALLFAAAIAAHYLFRGRLAALLWLAVPAATPYLAWQIALEHMFGHSGLAEAHTPPRLFLSGLHGARGTAALAADWIAVAGPSLGCAALLAFGIVSARSGGWRAMVAAGTSVATLLLAANLAFVWLLPDETFADLWAASRTADGLVLAALVHPQFATSRLRWLLVVGWLAGTPFLWFG